MTAQTSVAERFEVKVYSDGISEFFTLCHILSPTMEDLILHNEGPLGRAFVDLVYTDLDYIFSTLNFSSADSLSVGIDTIFECGGMMVPLLANLLDIRDRLSAGLPIDVSEVETQRNMLFHLQQRLTYLISDFLVDNPSQDLLLDYLLLTQEYMKDPYIPLTFGNVGLAIATANTGASFSTLTMTSLDLGECYNFLMYHMLRHGRQYRICKHCNRLFSVRPQSKIEYCDRPIGEGDKRCIDVGASRRYEKKNADIPAMREYQRSYKAHNARIRYGRMTREEFGQWAESAREKRDQCLAGTLSLEDFVAWLDSDKIK